MELKISELKPNPYKKHINKGKLNNQRIDVLKGGEQWDYKI